MSHVFFDTNVLVGGTIDFGERSKAPIRLLDAVAGGRLESVSTAWHCCLEFYSVTTRLPEEYRLAPEIALRFVREELLDRFEVFHLPVEARGGMLSDSVAEGVVGGRIYDAHIAEIARAAGAEIVVTDNRRHFTSLLRHGIRVLNSSEAADLLTPPP
jgi:predicted nucleic acid-binding protein